MRKFDCGDDVEIIGQTMLAIISNLAKDEIAPYLYKHEIEDIRADEWYPAKRWLNCMNDLAEHTNFMQNAVAIGMKIAQNLLIPPPYQNATLPEILQLWGEIYYNQHRGSSDIGYIKTIKLSETHYKTVHCRPYPDDVIYGVAYGFAKRFLPKGTRFTIKYDPNEERMDRGGKETIVHISW